MKKFLPVFSYLFHPIFIPVYGALYYFFGITTYYSNPEKYFAVFHIVLITIVLPVLFFFILRATGRVNSIMFAEISQRKIPLLLQCFLTIIIIKKGITSSHFPELYFFFLGGLASIITAFVLLFFSTKASLHMMAISTLTTFIVGLSLHHQDQNINAIAFIVLMNGFVASSRLQMKAHTPKELVIGFLLGVIPQILLYRFLL